LSTVTSNYCPLNFLVAPNRRSLVTCLTEGIKINNNNNNNNIHFYTAMGRNLRGSGGQLDHVTSTSSSIVPSSRRVGGEQNMMPSVSSVSLAAVLMSKPVQSTVTSVHLLLCLPLDLLPV